MRYGTGWILKCCEVGCGMMVQGRFIGVKLPFGRFRVGGR